MARSEGARTATRPRPLLVGIASILGVLMLLKFVIVKPITFLALAILFGVAAFLYHRGSAAGRILLVLLLFTTAVIYGGHLLDKGFDAGEYQNNTDYIVILLGLPLAIIGLVLFAMTVRGTRTQDTRRA